MWLENTYARSKGAPALIIFLRGHLNVLGLALTWRIGHLGHDWYEMCHVKYYLLCKLMETRTVTLHFVQVDENLDWNRDAK